MGYKLKRILIYPDGVTEKQVYPNVPPIPALCFTAEEANSTIKLDKVGSPTTRNFEISTDGTSWTDYTVGSTITLSNIGDKVYMRNKSGTAVGLSESTSKYYLFSMTGSIAASGDIGYLLCKNSTDTMPSTYCLYNLFNSCSSLTTPPRLPATTLTQYCYRNLFVYCSNLIQIPKLPGSSLQLGCYDLMFYGCSKIKLSETQTGDYTQEYRIPTTGTGTVIASPFADNMFGGTGGTFTGNPTINTTYYTSNTVV